MLVRIHGFGFVFNKYYKKIKFVLVFRILCFRGFSTLLNKLNKQEDFRRIESSRDFPLKKRA